jgi:lysozyme
MKFPKNIKLLFRTIVIVASLLLVTFLFIKLPVFFGRIISQTEKVAPPVQTFGIIIPKGYSVHGIDVSKHQGNIDWKRVSLMKNNGVRITFAFIKATEGVSRQDDKFKLNWEQSAQNGLMRGAYHFYYPSRNADKQAENFIEMVKLTKGDLPPVVDIEYSNGKSAKKICEGLKLFLVRLEKHYSVKPIIYTNIHFYNSNLKGNFDNYPLWIAGYFDHDRFYNEFITPWHFWQHSESGKVDGIRGKVDFNVFNGSLDDFKKLKIK